MFLVESKEGAIICMLVSLLLLGSWPAILTLLERRGRLPQHTYLDYSTTNFIAAVTIALTFGQIGESRPGMPNFITQLTQDNWPCILMAMVGGLFLGLGNISIQYAWAFVGLSVTQVITSSIAVVIGTTVNYFLDDKINKASLLFPGVAFFIVAVLLGSAVHNSNAADNKEKIRSFHENLKENFPEYQEKQRSFHDNQEKQQSFHEKVNDTPVVQESDDKETSSSSDSDVEVTMDIENIGMENICTEMAKKAGTAENLIVLESKRAIKVSDRSKLIGLSITFFAGICYALFSPAFNLATNDQWHMLKEGVPHLVVYTAFFYFSISFFVMAIILNVTFLYRPLLNLPRSSFKDYLLDNNGRPWAILAGLCCGCGNGLQFIGGQAAGYAAADAVQALPLVSTFWGVIFFGEYRRSSKKTYMLLATMLIMFSVAVALLLASAGQRKTVTSNRSQSQHKKWQLGPFFTIATLAL